MAEASTDQWVDAMLAVYDNLLDWIDRCARVGKTSTFVRANTKAAGDVGGYLTQDECNRVCASLLQCEGMYAEVRNGGIIVRWTRELEAN